MNVRVDPDSPVPPSRQLVAAMLDAVASGRLKPGEKLPSVRGLAASALVNPNTVQKAFRDLEHLGATEGRNGSGVFVTSAGPEIARAIRLGETLATFRQAAEMAVRAGHIGDVLVGVLGDALAAPQVDGKERAAKPAGVKR